MIQVAVLGAGVIGKRLAHSLAHHPTLTLAGIAVRGRNGFVCARPELPYYASDETSVDALAGDEVRVRGDLKDLLAAADVIVDCGPSRSGTGRYTLYRDAAVPSVFCGGERDARLGPLVHPELNLAAATEADSVRLLSCNTTALARIVAAIGVDRIAELDALIVRCATDTDKAAKGVTNGAVLGGSASHHADDLAAVAPLPRIRTSAMTVAMTSGHVIRARISLCAGESPEAAVDRLAGAPRILLRPGTEPLDTARIKAAWPGPWHARHQILVQRVPDDRPDELDLWISLDNESVTIPETLGILTAMGAPRPAPAGRSAR